MSAYKRRLLDQCRQLQAILILSDGITLEIKEELEGFLSSIPDLPKRHLIPIEQYLSERIDHLDTALGFRRPPEFYAELVGGLLPGPIQLWYATKHFIDTQLFKTVERAWPRWNRFPPHTRFGIDVKSVRVAAGKRAEWRLLEAALFEDLAMLWNESVRTQAMKGPLDNAELIPLKRFTTLMRIPVHREHSFRFNVNADSADAEQRFRSS